MRNGLPDHFGETIKEDAMLGKAESQVNAGAGGGSEAQNPFSIVTEKMILARGAVGTSPRTWSGIGHLLSQ
jgi:hypothetical protein